MPIDDYSLIFHCPHCGQPITMPALSPLARAIVEHTNGRTWRKGYPVSLRTWGIWVNADPRGVREAMQELMRAGYVATIPYGKRGRVQYVGVPGMLQRYYANAA